MPWVYARGGAVFLGESVNGRAASVSGQC